MCLKKKKQDVQKEIVMTEHRLFKTSQHENPGSQS